MAVTGYDFAPHLLPIGDCISNLERAILVREGISRADDQLPPRMDEPLPDGPAAGRFISAEMLNAMLGDCYARRGWDADGVPQPETLQSLGLVGMLS